MWFFNSKFLQNPIFANLNNDEKDDFVRTIVQTNITRDMKNLNIITISFLGTGFLRYMVRFTFELSVPNGSKYSPLHRRKVRYPFNEVFS